MKIGYPCINLTLNDIRNKTFRLKSYSEEKLIKTIENNLNHLSTVLEFNIKNNILFFRITSDLIPFASHPICKFSWGEFFKDKFQYIGDLIQRGNVRISMHPDQFTLINSPNKRIHESSEWELEYHSQVLDCMGLDGSAKIQIHVGGVYGHKERSLSRFINRYEKLPKNIRERLVIENDDRSYSLRDCMFIHEKTDIPVLLDVFHHEIHNCGETLEEAVELASLTWNLDDGLPMVDYSSQQAGGKRGRHAHSIDIDDFGTFLERARSYDFDIMLEIKDKERSCLKAIEIASDDIRFRSTNKGSAVHHG